MRLLFRCSFEIRDHTQSFARGHTGLPADTATRSHPVAQFLQLGAPTPTPAVDHPGRDDRELVTIHPSLYSLQRLSMPGIEGTKGSLNRQSGPRVDSLPARVGQ